MRTDAAADDAASAELVDVVDGDDRVVGTVTRREMRQRRLCHRAVFIAVLSSPTVEGRCQLLVHRRAAHKDIWPDRWDIAVGGVVCSGEQYDGAAVRELAEEIGIAGVDLEVLGRGGYADADVDLIGRCYAIEHDGPFSFDDGEVVESRWVDRAALDDMRRAGTSFVPDSIALVLPLIESRLA